MSLRVVPLPEGMQNITRQYGNEKNDGLKRWSKSAERQGISLEMRI